MQLHQLQDHQLLTATKTLVGKEREILTSVLQHLREIDRRRLYSDLGYQSLFEYAVRELKYSESQASHRLNAMRLIQDIPHIEQSIANGDLSLSNASQAQRVFRQNEKQESGPLSKNDKLKVLDTLKNKSTRDGQRVLLELNPQQIDPRTFERERQITSTAAEVRFVLDDTLRAKLDEVKTLLGPKAIDLSYTDLITEMAKLSVEKLSENKFGKKRAAESAQKVTDEKVTATPQSDSRIRSAASKNPRYISQTLSHAVWTRDGGRCQQCDGTRNLNIDHVVPVACGGEATLENLRLLCFSCNQRQAIIMFGVTQQNRYRREGV